MTLLEDDTELLDSSTELPVVTVALLDAKSMIDGAELLGVEEGVATLDCVPKVADELTS